MENNELKHYGVLGMRWGVRRRRTKDGVDSEDSVRARRSANKSIDELSNKELRELNDRIRLEQEHAELVKKASLGQKFLDRLSKTATTVENVNKIYTKGLVIGKGLAKLDDDLGLGLTNKWDSAISGAAQKAVNKLSKTKLTQDVWDDYERYR